ncbi:MAG: lactonase family protein [Trueperaceae bacterium]
MQQFFFVGSYTHPSLGGQGEGIYICGLETSSGRLSNFDVQPVLNPSYLTLTKKNNVLFAVQECGNDLHPSGHAFRIQPGLQPKLEPLNTQPTHGEYTCHLSVDAEDTFLAVANYGGGNVALFAVNEHGRLSETLNTMQHHGKSIHERQEGPHAHAVGFSPDNKFLLVTDLGLDEVKSYTFKGGKLEPYSTFKLSPGSGPRHLVFHPNERHALIVNELSATLTLAHYQAGMLAQLQTVSTLPEGYTGDKWAAAVRVSANGKHIYASNRLHNSLTVFNFDEEKETLVQQQVISSGGTIPRDFVIDPTGRILITAHQNSHDLYSFWIDDTGRLEPTGHRLELGSPVCVTFLK